MTAYFDRANAQIRAAQTSEELAAIDQRIVEEVGFATMQPGFPADLAARIDAIFLERSIWANSNLRAAPWTGPTDQAATEDDYKALLQRMQWDLHTVFHDRAQLERHAGDNPTNWYLSLLADAEERRENLAVAQRGEHPQYKAEREALARESET